jgi:Holliday junction resolvase RusA-like endonuclease
MTRFRVTGIPVPQGSMKARVIGKNRASVFHSSSSKLKKWRGAIGVSAKAAIQEKDRLKDSPLSVKLVFEMPRPASVRRPAPSVPPDLDKLVRAVFDGLEGIAFTNDSRVVSLEASKAYAPEGGEPGVTIEISDP